MCLRCQVVQLIVGSMDDLLLFVSLSVGILSWLYSILSWETFLVLSLPLVYETLDVATWVFFRSLITKKGVSNLNPKYAIGYFTFIFLCPKMLTKVKSKILNYCAIIALFFHLTCVSYVV